MHSRPSMMWNLSTSERELSADLVGFLQRQEDWAATRDDKSRRRRESAYGAALFHLRQPSLTPHSRAIVAASAAGYVSPHRRPTVTATAAPASQKTATLRPVDAESLGRRLYGRAAEDHRKACAEAADREQRAAARQQLVQLLHRRQTCASPERSTADDGRRSPRTHARLYDDAARRTLRQTLREVTADSASPFRPTLSPGTRAWAEHHRGPRVDYSRLLVSPPPKRPEDSAPPEEAPVSPQRRVDVPAFLERARRRELRRRAEIAQRRDAEAARIARECTFRPFAPPNPVEPLPGIVWERRASPPREAATDAEDPLEMSETLPRAPQAVSTPPPLQPQPPAAEATPAADAGVSAIHDSDPEPSVASAEPTPQKEAGSPFDVAREHYLALRRRMTDISRDLNLSIVLEDS